MNLFCFPAVIFVSVEKATTMSKIIQEGKMEGELAVAKPRSSVFDFQQAWTKGKSSSFGPDVPNIEGEHRRWIRGLWKEAAANCRRNSVGRSRGELQAGHCPKKSPKLPKRILKFGKETTSLDGVAGNCNGAMPKALCLTILKRAAGNCRQDTVPRQHGWKFKGLRETATKDWNPTADDPGITCKSQIMGTLRKSSWIFAENCTQKTLPGACHSTPYRERTLRTPWLKIKLCPRHS